MVTVSQTSINGIAFENIFSTHVYASLFWFKSSFISLTTCLFSIFPNHFLIICGCYYLPFSFSSGYLTSGRKSMFSSVLELCIKGCKCERGKCQVYQKTPPFSIDLKSMPNIFSISCLAINLLIIHFYNYVLFQ